MKILAISDEECKALWDYMTPDKIAGVELVIACGDGKCVEILTVQAEGKRAMSAAEYLRGSAVEKGSIATA